MWSAVKMFVGLRPRAWIGIVSLGLMTLLVTVTYVAQGVLIARLLFSVFSSFDAGKLVTSLIFIGLLQAVRVVVIVVRDGYAPKVSARVKEAVREALTLKLMEIGPGQVQRMRTGDLQSTLVDSVELLDPLVGRFVPTVAASVLGSCLASAYIIMVDPAVGMVVLICALCAPLSKLAGERLIREPGMRWRKSFRAMYSEHVDAIQGMATLKAFNASGARGRDLAAHGRQFCKDSIALMIVWCGTSSISVLMVPIGTSAAIALGAWHTTTGAISVAGLFTILMLTRETFRPMDELESAYHSAYYAIPAAEEVAELLRMEALAQDAEVVGKNLAKEPPGLVFDDVRFCYPTRSEPALAEFNLTVHPAERVAIVGRSGAGKSTLLSLLMRYFDPDSGAVRIDGCDIREFPQADLRSLVGVVSQDTYLFHGTVRDNLLLAKPDASDDEITRAVTAARASEFISSLPHGVDTVVGEQGLKLSGGQRQRIAIARALLKDAPVLVLDEPTSSIDAANEAAITRSLGELSRGRTTLIIAHRLSTVRDADRIVVMDSGRVVEAGTHSELLALNGSYAELVATQTGVSA